MLKSRSDSKRTNFKVSKTNWCTKFTSKHQGKCRRLILQRHHFSSLHQANLDRRNSLVCSREGSKRTTVPKASMILTLLWLTLIFFITVSTGKGECDRCDRVVSGIKSCSEYEEVVNVFQSRQRWKLSDDLFDFQMSWEKSASSSVFCTPSLDHQNPQSPVWVSVTSEQITHFCFSKHDQSVCAVTVSRHFEDSKQFSVQTAQRVLEY